jgi:SAM-dependent methyltransferase
MAMLTAQDWHERYAQQARWTRDLRAYLFQKARLNGMSRLLDVGCGTGVLESEIRAFSGAVITGLDIDPGRLGLAQDTTAMLSEVGFVQGDALGLPLASASFDACLCHFLLLWLPDPLQALREMARVIRPGGSLLVLAEPDYGGRIDYPAELSLLGEQQTAALRRQGADPHLGRKLRELMRAAGLQEVETGLMGGQWVGPGDPQESELEWAVLKDDLVGALPADELPHLQAGELERLQALDRQARAEGRRVLFVPTFYSWGNVKQT